MAFKVFISGYGIYEAEGTREEVEADAEDKRRWERARRSLVWDASLSTPLDKITAEIAELWSAGKGVPTEMLQERNRLMALVTEHPHGD
ncbi:hypothetical protein [Methylobacterium sp. Leaf106]|uniref:hypothetical protein n=1 Tax=Methylobacterium sp. Leaf106 TaxID=1736255 RepID=UPI0006FE4CB3|nr:hypothetical protein [Methylobacterium sp. Leaf106]KQP53074.1 hypothetical protein ASF34_01515 [Methylobacterium sp. Leaf106]